MKKIYTIALFLSFAAVIITIKLIMIINDENVSAAAANKGTYTITSIEKYAEIYDCNMLSLVNCSEKYNAVVIPNHISSIKLQPYLADTETYYNVIKGNLPFLCEVKKEALNAEIGTLIFKSAVRNSSEQLAPHIIGYLSDNQGVCGIEKSYNDFLRENAVNNSVTFQVDAVGEVLNGLEHQTVISENSTAGIITTLDKNIQQMCETAFKTSSAQSGAVVVMDIKTGEIKASMSYPNYDINNLSEYINHNNSPFLNRAMSAYSVGSIFKLVTSAAALEQGISSEFTYTCTGSINVSGQVFNCHKWGGHGEIDMNEAIVCSCNTYFIALSEYLDKEKYIDLASSLGFGEEIILCDDIISVAGHLQSAKDIAVPAECANMSFGQGMLSATPLQICRMTAAIANDGIINQPSLIKGIRKQDGTIIYNPITVGERVLSYKTTSKLKSFMIKTVRAENSLAEPDKTIAAGKTSTAQTGWYDANGSEIYNCWFTGYFPSYSPKYAVTVLVEGGISGNTSAGPIFKKIADDITEYEKSLRN